jgi:hypothetical protein
MTGQWIKHQASEHKCDPPAPSAGSNGDLWKCDQCHGVWCVAVDWRGEHYWLNGKPIQYEKPQVGYSSLAEQRDGLGIDPR